MYKFIKRLLDIIVSFMLIIIIFIPMIIIDVIVKLETSGPSIFIQRRVGKDSKVFNILKG